MPQIPTTSVLVTGASGLVGSAVVRELDRLGFRVTGLTRRTEPLPGIETITGDLAQDSGAIFGRSTFEVVIHAAGIMQGSEADFQRINVKGTERICRQAEAGGVRTMVLISTAAVYGSAPSLNADESRPPVPEGSYAASKAAAESVARSILGERLTILRPVTVYRTGACPFIDQLAMMIRSGSLPRVPGRNPPIDLVHVDDLALAIAAALGRGAGQVLNVAGPEPIPYLHLGDLAAAALGIRPAWVPAAAPEEKAEPGLAPPESFPPHLYSAATVTRTLSCGRARAILDYRPTRSAEVEIPRALQASGYRQP